ncbi:uncharacterized protein EI90DRAFT_2123908 [Cantharellus anzutake]|uniref:uncharacterized protein n=1 Tax=Cantharellus anzutake TaxID=1750568 RepID=UPI0019061F33|nr:uncharacterized protein EI90DRAFT_2123908 [Cantharellus anzutake]KAF8325565.1 hypothetical protein EI90DRAFT_2123908 [Cantharellus anzutake]
MQGEVRCEMNAGPGIDAWYIVLATMHVCTNNFGCLLVLPSVMIRSNICNMQLWRSKYCGWAVQARTAHEKWTRTRSLFNMGTASGIDLSAAATHRQPEKLERCCGRWKRKREKHKKRLIESECARSWDMRKASSEPTLRIYMHALIESITSICIPLTPSRAIPSSL